MTTPTPKQDVLLDDESLMPRSELMARYRQAFLAANGRAPEAVVYRNGFYLVQSSGSRSQMRRKDFVEALIALERRAGCSRSLRSRANGLSQ